MSHFLSRISMDHWMSTLFPTENQTIEDFGRLSARLRAAMAPHVVDIYGNIFRLSSISWQTP